MNEGRNFGSACYNASDNCVYTIGGCLTENSSSVERLDLKSGVWKRLADTKTKRDSAGVIADQLGNVYAIGGYDNTNEKYSRTIEKMSVGTGSLEESKWRTLKCRMVEGRRKPGVVRHLGRI